MSPVDMEDVTGTPRPTRDIEAALRWVEHEIVLSPTRVNPAGPAVIHLVVIRDVLREDLKRRAVAK